MIKTLSILLIAATATAQQSQNYSPLSVSGKVTVVDEDFTYGKQDRKVPLRIYLPESKQAAPVLLFSHGLGGSRENSKYLGSHWAGRGYVVVVMQHAGSDIDVIKDAPRLQKLTVLKSAANAENAQARYADVKATLDHVEIMNQAGGQLEGRFDLSKVGMSGHSFGAVTTQAVSGQNFGPMGQKFTDGRIKAAVAFSPSPPAYGDRGDTFGKVKIPWLLMTGTKDGSPIGNRTDAASRRLVFQQLPIADIFYELVFEAGEHHAFSDQLGLGKSNRNPNHHPAILGISTAFWDAWLLDDAQAKHWLNGSGPKTLLESGDVWQRK